MYFHCKLILVTTFTFQASDARDALAKSIYSCLFDWLVEQINKSLAVGKRRTGRSISILDIYGFESFEVCPCFFFLCVPYFAYFEIYSHSQIRFFFFIIRGTVLSNSALITQTKGCNSILTGTYLSWSKR